MTLLSCPRDAVFRRSAALRGILTALVTITGLLSAALRPAAAHAQTGQLQLLSLPRSVLPAHATVHGAPADNHAADAVSQLHTVSLTQLGRVGGYAESVWWTLRPPAAHSKHKKRKVPGVPYFLQYSASVFSSVDAAGAAYGDARATLWEAGYPIQLLDVTRPAVQVMERDGHTDVYFVNREGPIEVELRLRYGAKTDKQTRQNAMWTLRKAVIAAGQRMHRVALTVPPAPAGTVTSPQSVYLAPWGTGPVVKSPSLMVFDTTQMAAGTQFDPGVYRSLAETRLAARTVRHALLVPTGGSVRYVRTANLNKTVDWYDAVTLYHSSDLAAQALSWLGTANSKVAGMQAFGAPGSSAWADTAQAWRGNGQTMIVFRLQNVLMVLAGTGQQASTLPVLAAALARTVPTWLHASGIQIVNASNQPVHLDCLNWYGAEQQDFVVGGLDFRSYQTILQTIQQQGYDCIRLLFSNQLIEQNPVVTAHLAASAELAGLHALDILDRIIGYAGALGMSVIIDDHRSDAGWSAQESGLWYTPAYPDTAFDHDWSTMATRYAVNNVVIGADLRNEPHGPATWGDNNPATDWLAAAQRAGNAVLAANPHLLVMVEGIQTYAKTSSYWWGGNLMGVATAPVVLQFADGSSAHSQLVYSPHDYGPDNCGQGCPWFNTATTYDSLAALWEQNWGYITADPRKPYAAPVFIGEFGTCNDQPTCVSNPTPGSQGQWFSSLVRYIASKHVSWAYWSANGTRSTSSDAGRAYGEPDRYGLFSANWVSPSPWIEAALRPIQTDGASTR